MAFKVVLWAKGVPLSSSSWNLPLERFRMEASRHARSNSVRIHRSELARSRARLGAASASPSPAQPQPARDAVVRIADPSPPTSAAVITRKKGKFAKKRVASTVPVPPTPKAPTSLTSSVGAEMRLPATAPPSSPSEGTQFTVYVNFVQRSLMSVRV
jgi:hypothetical protein